MGCVPRAEGPYLHWAPSHTAQVQEGSENRTRRLGDTVTLEKAVSSWTLSSLYLPATLPPHQQVLSALPKKTRILDLPITPQTEAPP